MVEISNADTVRIISCLDIAVNHYKSQSGLRNNTHAWAINQLKEKLLRKLINPKSKSLTK